MESRIDKELKIWDTNNRIFCDITYIRSIQVRLQEARKRRWVVNKGPVIWALEHNLYLCQKESFSGKRADIQARKAPARNLRSVRMVIWRNEGRMQALVSLGDVQNEIKGHYGTSISNLVMEPRNKMLSYGQRVYIRVMT